MTDHPDLQQLSCGDDRAMGEARVEFAEMLFQEGPDVSPGEQAATELTAQVQASVSLAIYYELRHGNDVLAAHTRALNEHRAALAEFTALAPALSIPTVTVEPVSVQPVSVQPLKAEPELPPAREPVD